METSHNNNDMNDEPEIVVDFAAAEEVAPLTEEIQNHADPMGSGFLWYTPPLASTKEHRTGGHEWMISGHDMQVLTTTVPPGEQVVTEIGSFMYGSVDMKTSVELTLCSRVGFAGGLSRILGGESCVKVMLTNASNEEGYVGITPNFPAKIVPIKFGHHISPDHALISQGGAYMSHLGDVNVGCDLDASLRTCCCAGFGCFRQKITGSDESIAFLAAGGTLIYRYLSENETITVDSRSVVAMEETVTLGIAPNGRICMCCLGGEGCFSTTLTGPGKVFMQSMNFQKFRDAVQTTVIDDRGDGSESAFN